MKVLVIEDNIRLTDRIKKVLEKAYIVAVSFNGEDGLNLALKEDYGVIILDLGLPDIPGLEVCKALRANDVDVPILILTAVDDVSSKVQLLSSGADDYLTKPFSGAELEARVAALARRQPRQMIADTLLVQDLEINTARREVRRSGIQISLRRKEFDILEYLVSNRGRAMSREMILDHAWQDGVSSWNNTVDVHIKHLRDKVDRPFRQPLIKTAYGIGYMVEDSPNSQAEFDKTNKNGTKK